jgi:hypothetical protein
MNMPPTSSQTQVTNESRPQESLRNVDPRDAQQKRDAFEDLLRAKLAKFGDAEDEETAAEEGVPAFVTGMPAPQAARLAPPAPTTAGIETIKTGARAAIETALNSQPAVSAVGATDSAGVWEASVREANSVPVDVRITRAEKTAHEPQVGLTVAVASSEVAAETLARHVPRLNERLRKRGTGLDHVRIQRDEGDA